MTGKVSGFIVEVFLPNRLDFYLQDNSKRQEKRLGLLLKHFI
jgi:hypothetical protein